ncbi:hypothetical protein OE88DRAFT_790305 [Heliocybe sulcata]|uniref:DUF1349-domain-containing protein n=1 Tax=Heliocybe sulcata TaxID=5364 RepID=A0A5C3MR37_9AGAM|nr:hypothetical protein OE88DRAFT_790305 [Heliocybe sulcata]
MGYRFSVLNGDFSVPESAHNFVVTAPPNTDIWRIPTRDVFSAPVLFVKERLSKFKKVRVTVKVPGTRLYDQGGLIFILPGHPQRWIKAGIEYVDGVPKVGTIVTDRYSDWSLVSLQNPEKGEVTIEMEKEGESLWVYMIDGDGKRTAMREVTWVYAGEHEEVMVGVYAARPTDDGTKPGELDVTFEQFVLEGNE